MVFSRHNPNGLDNGMIVRKLSAPTKAFRVRGDPDRNRATYVALSKGERTVLNGNARNYRPETTDEAIERQGNPPRGGNTGGGDAALGLVSQPPSASASASASDRDTADSAESIPRDESCREIAVLCANVMDVVASIRDGTCTPSEAADIVSAAAALNGAVTRIPGADSRSCT